MHRKRRGREPDSSANNQTKPSRQQNFLQTWDRSRDHRDRELPVTNHRRHHSHQSKQETSYANVDSSTSSGGSDKYSTVRRRSLTYVPTSAWVKDFKDEDDTDAYGSIRNTSSNRSPDSEILFCASKSSSPVQQKTTVVSKQLVIVQQEPVPPRPPPRANRNQQQSARIPPLALATPSALVTQPSQSPPSASAIQPPTPPRAPRPPPRKFLPNRPPPPPPSPSPPSSQLPLPSPKMMTPKPSSAPHKLSPQMPLPPSLKPPSKPPPPPRSASASVKKDSFASDVVSDHSRVPQCEPHVASTITRQALAGSTRHAVDMEIAATASSKTETKKRRVLSQPSEVALLLHEILVGGAIRAGAGETVPAEGSMPGKSTHGSGVSRANKDKLKKESQKLSKKSTKMRSYSSESKIVHILAEIIAENISRADRHKCKQNGQGDSIPRNCKSLAEPTKVSSRTEINKKAAKARQHSKHKDAAATDKCVCRQQNFNNCFNKPHKIRNRRWLCQTHALCMRSVSRSRIGDRCGSEAVLLGRFSADMRGSVLPRSSLLSLCRMPVRTSSECGVRLLHQPNASKRRANSRHSLFFETSICSSRVHSTATPVSISSLKLEDTRNRSRSRSTDEAIASVRSETPELSTDAINFVQVGVIAALTSSSSQAVLLEISSDSRTVAGRQCQHYWKRNVDDSMSQAATSTAASIEELFGCILNCRDESNLLLPMEDTEVTSLKSVPADTGSEFRYGDRIETQPMIQILVPESLRISERDTVLDMEATQLLRECSNSECTYFSSKTEQLKLSRRSSTLSAKFSAGKSGLLSKSNIEVESALESNWVATLPARPWIDRENFNGAVKITERKQTTFGRRSRVQIVLPLAEAIQHQIELPSCIVEQSFSSWRPLKYVQQLKLNLPIVTPEITTPVSISQTINIVGRFSESEVTKSVIRTKVCCRASSPKFTFARCVASRIVNFSIVRYHLLGSSIELAGDLFNISLLKTTNRSEANDGSKVGRHQQCASQYDFPPHFIDLTWPPCCFNWASERPANHVNNDRIELLRVATNLAIQCHANQISQESGVNKCLANPLKDVVFKLLSPTESSLRLKPVIQQGLVAKVFKRISKNCRLRNIILHCPELVINQIFAGVSQAGAADSSFSTLDKQTQLGYSMQNMQKEVQQRQQPRQLQDPYSKKRFKYLKPELQIKTTARG